MKKMLRASVVLLMAVSGCGGSDFEPPDRRARVDAALAEYSPALFDSIMWTESDDPSSVGNTVYAERCVRCHGPLGKGETEYALSRGLAIPSLVEADWSRASLDSIRRAVYAGHESGMPIFSERRLTPREIDASSRYILFTLRPDVLGGR